MLVYDIVEYGEKYIEVPTSIDINEYGMVEDVCFSIKDKQKQTTLFREIHGKGAFRRFRENTEKMDLE